MYKEEEAQVVVGMDIKTIDFSDLTIAGTTIEMGIVENVGDDEDGDRAQNLSIYTTFL